MLIHVRDLGIRNNGKRGYMWAEFECPKCGAHIELMKHQGKAQEQCQKCFREYHRKTQIKHGDRYSRLYRTWINMRQRCNNEKEMHYKNYGGRGIKVCSEWNDYQTFKEWAIANGYDETLTIDRIDVNGNYEPKNCQWITNSENSRKDTIVCNKALYLKIKSEIPVLGRLAAIKSNGISETAYYNARNRYDRQ